MKTGIRVFLSQLADSCFQKKLFWVEMNLSYFWIPCLVFKLSATHIVRVVKGSKGLKHKDKTRCKVNMSRPERVIKGLCSSTYRLSTHRTSIAGYTRLSRQLLGATSGLGVLAKQLFAGVGITGSDYGNAPRTIPQHLTAVAID